MIHGSIQIGTSIIGAWNIGRIEKLTGAGNWHRYRYFVTIGDYPVTGEIDHLYSDGAAELLAKVFANVAEEMRGVHEQRLRGYAERIIEIQDL